MAIDRRTLLAAIGLFAVPGASVGQSRPVMRVFKDPDCSCCTAWIKLVREAGFTVEVTETADMDAVKARLGVPGELGSCHTAEVWGYVIEGHVPPAEILRLIHEKQPAAGLAVPGMPVGSPGMEVPGAAPESYDVVLFGPAATRTYARYRGHVRTR